MFLSTVQSWNGWNYVYRYSPIVNSIIRTIIKVSCANGAVIFILLKFHAVVGLPLYLYGLEDECEAIVIIWGVGVSWLLVLVLVMS